MLDRNDSQAQVDAAVIDVGSNSVRLVCYRLDGRAVWTVFNEKVLAGLGRDLATTGRLSPDGMAAAMVALSRFRALVEARRPAASSPPPPPPSATPPTARHFAAACEREAGLALRMLTGEEEARYAALGVLAGAPVRRAWWATSVARAWS